MFKVGDKIVYPMHGAGIVQGIEEREVLGEKHMYYLMSLKNMRVMLPIRSDVGVREIVDSATLEGVINCLQEEGVVSELNATQKQRFNLNKIKSGDILQVAEVIRDLDHLSKARPLSTGDKNILDNARQILISELVLVKDITSEEATEIVDEALDVVQEEVPEETTEEAIG